MVLTEFLVVSWAVETQRTVPIFTGNSNLWIEATSNQSTCSKISYFLYKCVGLCSVFPRAKDLSQHLSILTEHPILLTCSQCYLEQSFSWPLRMPVHLLFSTIVRSLSGRKYPGTTLILANNYPGPPFSPISMSGALYQTWLLGEYLYHPSPSFLWINLPSIGGKPQPSPPLPSSFQTTGGLVESGYVAINSWCLYPRVTLLQARRNCNFANNSGPNACLDGGCNG